MVIRYFKERSNRMDINHLTGQIIDAAIEVHKELGPGLLESTYEGICHEFKLQHVNYARQQSFPIEYKCIKLDCGYRMISVSLW
jgi:GxxExxY protein